VSPMSPINRQVDDRRGPGGSRISSALTVSTYLIGERNSALERSLHLRVFRSR